MKKTINMPEVRVINFRSNDVIATSPQAVSYGGSNAKSGAPVVAETQGRESIWE